ncbi:MAG TPA: DUF2169 domain-containing protein [Polyangiaceae bacterium]|nr:DUF2169 domain-containing protein [Polyangiaceae bacterium]
MNFQNDSGFPATVARAQLLYRDLMLATVIVKASFDVDPSGQVRPVPAEHQLPVSESDQATALGTIDGDFVPLKPGCDVAFLGHARSPWANVPVQRVDVDIRVGTLRRSLVVFGDRIWVATGTGPQATAPVPFTALPLTYDRAFGGVALAVGKIEMTHPTNPGGRGLVCRSEHAAGTKLPNLEESDQLIGAWNQTPLVAGVAPLPRGSSLRAENAYHIDADNELVQLAPAAFSSAHPRMRIARYPAGEQVVVHGMTHDRPWVAALPPAQFGLSLTLGDASYQLPLITDTLYVLPDYNRIVVVARRAIVYQILPNRPRVLQVFAGTPPTPSELGSIGQERRAHAPSVAFGPAATPEAMPLPFDAMLALYPLTQVVESLPLCLST